MAGLGFQCFPKRSDRKVTGDIAVRYAGNHTSVMQIYNGTVIAYFMIRKEQIGKIRAPFPVDFICCKILVQLIIEYLMRFPCSYPGFFGRTMERRSSSVFIYL